MGTSEKSLPAGSLAVPQRESAAIQGSATREGASPVLPHTAQVPSEPTYSGGLPWSPPQRQGALVSSPQHRPARAQTGCRAVYSNPSIGCHGACFARLGTERPPSQGRSRLAGSPARGWLGDTVGSAPPGQPIQAPGGCLQNKESSSNTQMLVFVCPPKEGHPRASQPKMPLVPTGAGGTTSRKKTRDSPTPGCPSASMPPPQSGPLQVGFPPDRTHDSPTPGRRSMPPHGLAPPTPSLSASRGCRPSSRG